MLERNTWLAKPVCKSAGLCVHAQATRPHTHTLALASIHKTMALSNYELIATFEYVYSHKGSDHSEKLARKLVWHVSMNDGNILDAIEDSELSGYMI